MNYFGQKVATYCQEYNIANCFKSFRLNGSALLFSTSRHSLGIVLIFSSWHLKSFTNWLNNFDHFWQNNCYSGQFSHFEFCNDGKNNNCQHPRNGLDITTTITRSLKVSQVHYSIFGKDTFYAFVSWTNSEGQSNLIVYHQWEVTRR